MTDGFRLTPLDALLAEPEEHIAYVVDAMLPSGGIGMLVAKPKVGKSTLARNLAVAVARGEPFFGRETAQGAVVYLALEEKRAEVARHFRHMGANGLPIYIHTGATPADALAALAAAIATHRPALVIIDPLARLVRVRDGNAYAEVAMAMEPVIDLARGCGAHLLLVHHAGKGDRSGGDGVLGSTAYFGGVDTLMQMRRRDSGRTLETINRYGVDLPEIVATMDEVTGTVAPGGEMAAMRQGQSEDAILAALAGDALTEDAIKERVGGNTADVQKAIRSLVATGSLARSGAGRKGDPFRYSLPAATPDDGRGDEAGNEYPPADGREKRAERDAHLLIFPYTENEQMSKMGNLTRHSGGGNDA